MSYLPTDDKARKSLPLFQQLVRYFPKTLREVTKVSVVNNVRYNPEREPADINWNRGKSPDQFGSAFRHMLERTVDGKIYDYVDPEVAKRTGIERIYVLAQAVWRLSAACEEEIEAMEREQCAPQGTCGEASAPGSTGPVDAWPFTVCGCGHYLLHDSEGMWTDRARVTHRRTCCTSEGLEPSAATTKLDAAPVGPLAQAREYAFAGAALHTYATAPVLPDPSVAESIIRNAARNMAERQKEIGEPPQGTCGEPKQEIPRCACGSWEVPNEFDHVMVAEQGTLVHHTRKECQFANRTVFARPEVVAEKWPRRCACGSVMVGDRRDSYAHGGKVHAYHDCMPEGNV